MCKRARLPSLAMMTLLLMATADALLPSPVTRPLGIGMRPRAHPVMVAAPSPPSPPPSQSIWESLLPGVTIGMTERQRIRLAHMYLPHEPLPQEAIGAGLLLGTMGAGMGGLFGLLMGEALPHPTPPQSLPLSLTRAPS
jgi:hypothetical protein